MARIAWSCPNCDSELCSAIRFWKPKQTDFIDMYVCHDCGMAHDPATKQELSTDYQPERKLATVQPDLFGNIANVRDEIKIVPKLVESPAGLSVCVAMLPQGASVEYAIELKRMMLEINKKSSGREMPNWYKYRKIKRGNI